MSTPTLLHPDDLDAVTQRLLYVQREAGHPTPNEPWDELPEEHRAAWRNWARGVCQGEEPGTRGCGGVCADAWEAARGLATELAAERAP